MNLTNEPVRITCAHCGGEGVHGFGPGEKKITPEYDECVTMSLRCNHCPGMTLLEVVNTGSGCSAVIRKPIADDFPTFGRDI